MAETINEYLIKLGFDPDLVSFARFSSVMRDASSLVGNQFGGMVKKVIEWQTGLTGAFIGAGTAALGLADSVAMSDQSYRLLALHMYTSLPVARELKVALDALGEPLENIMWDPELARRFQQLVKDQQEMTQQLGPDFENQMLKIRDVRFEFVRFGVELKYLTMEVVKLLAESFGTSVDGLLQKMRDFNAWFIENMPQISNWLANHLKPILLDIRNVFRETVGLGKEMAATFTNLIGLISGNKAIQGTTLDWKNFGIAIQTASGMLGHFVVDLIHAEEIALHLVSGVADMLSGNYKAMHQEFDAASALISKGTVAVLGGVSGAAAGGAGGAALGMALAGPPGALVGGPLGTIIGGAGGAFLGYDLTRDEANLKYVPQVISNLAQVMGVDPKLALAVAQAESGFQQYDKSGNVLMSSTPGSHAMGIFQLQPGTAKSLGVDATNPYGNVYGGIKYLKQLLAQFHGNEFLALQRYYGSSDAEKNRDYAEHVMALERGGIHGDIHVTVNVATNSNPEEIAKKTAKAVSDAQKKRVQRNISEFMLPGTSY